MVNKYSLIRNAGIFDPVQGKCESCAAVFVWSRKEYGGLADGGICPTCGAKLVRTSKLSALPFYLVSGQCRSIVEPLLI